MSTHIPAADIHTQHAYTPYTYSDVTNIHTCTPHTHTHAYAPQSQRHPHTTHSPHHSARHTMHTTACIHTPVSVNVPMHMLNIRLKCLLGFWMVVFQLALTLALAGLAGKAVVRVEVEVVLAVVRGKGSSASGDQGKGVSDWLLVDMCNCTSAEIVVTRTSDATSLCDHVPSADNNTTNDDNQRQSNTNPNRHPPSTIPDLPTALAPTIPTVTTTLSPTTSTTTKTTATTTTIDNTACNIETCSYVTCVMPSAPGGFRHPPKELGGCRYLEHLHKKTEFGPEEAIKAPVCFTSSHQPGQ